MSMRLRLTHINDCHAHFDGAPFCFPCADGRQWRTPCGGYGRLLTRLTALRHDARAGDMPFLFLHGGDTFQGSLYFNRFKARASSDLLSMLAPDAMVVGNHEFDLGNSALVEFMRHTGFPLLAANMDNRADAAPYPHGLNQAPQLFDCRQPWLTKIVGGVPFALIGLTSPQMQSLGNPDAHTRFLAAETTLSAAIGDIHAAGIRHIILLSHLGLECDRQIARQFPALSLIVGGHTHSLLGDLAPLGLPSEGSYPLFEADVAIVQAGHSALCLGVCDLEFDAQGRVSGARGGIEWLPWQPWPFADTPPSNLHWCEPDALLEAHLAQRYRPALVEMASHVVTQLTLPLIHQRLPDAHWPQGSQVAPLVATAMLDCARAQQVGEIDFALHNAGGVRCSLEPGPLTAADIAGRLLPFAIPLTVYQVRGDELAQTLESAINNATNNGVIGHGSGSYPYVAGLRFHYHATRPLGARLSGLMWECKPGQWQAIEPTRVYRGVSSAYTASGKEGYHALIQTFLAHHRELGITLADAFIRWASSRETLTPLPNFVHYSG
ncbi:MAG: bifunctional metallophosphatase/5'-nucleotidase [Aeromonas sp.]